MNAVSTHTPLIRLGFLSAGLVNILGTLTFTAGFSNARIAVLNPGVFSNFGIVCIMLWGLAYIAVARRHAQVPALVAVFALEKFVYVCTWVCWLAQSGSLLPGLLRDAPLTAMFYSSYGLIDLGYGLFFAAVALSDWRAAK